MRSSHRPADIWAPHTWTGGQKRHMSLEIPSSVPYLLGLPDAVCRLINDHIELKKDAGVYADDGVRVFCKTDPQRPKIIPRADGDNRGILSPGDDRQSWISSAFPTTPAPPIYRIILNRLTCCRI